MSVTGIKSEQIKDGEVKRSDLNTSSSGSAVITKVIAGTNISISSTGADAGTGDVTINASSGGGAITSSFLVGETITSGNAVYINSPLSFDSSKSDYLFGYDSTAYAKIGFRIIGNGGSISNMKLALRTTTGSVTDNCIVRIETDSSGSPSGTLVNANATATIAASSLSTTYTDVTVNFSGSFSLTDLTTYWVVCSRDGAYNTSNFYCLGNASARTMTFLSKYYDNGSWGTGSTTSIPYFYCTASYMNVLNKSSNNNNGSNKFLGFANQSKSFLETCSVDISGLSATQSGLSTSSEYFLSSTYGAITTSPSGIRYSVGTAMSTTAILIYYVPSSGVTSQSIGTWSVSTTSSNNIDCGFQPRYVLVFASGSNAGAGSSQSVGSSDGTNNYCNYCSQASNAGSAANNDSSNCWHVQYGASDGTNQSGYCDNFNSRGFRMNNTYTNGGNSINAFITYIAIK